MKAFLLFLIAILTSTIALGQDTGTQTKSDTAQVKLFTIYPGYVVTRDDDTIHGYLMLKNLIANQDKVLFYNDPEGIKSEVIKYKPKKLKAYKVGPRYYESFKFRPGKSSYATNDANAYHFVIRTVDGPISLYKWFYETTAESENRVQMDTEHLEKTKIDLSFSEENLHSIMLGKLPNGEFVNFDKMLIGFKKKMSKLVSDYPQLAKKIASKQEGYRWSDIETIVREYNKWYLQNHPDWKD